jgi:hypothetical protein
LTEANVKQLSKIGPVTTASLMVIAAIGVSCTPPATIGSDKDKPAYVTPPVDALGKIDFNEFDARLASYRYGNSHAENRPCKNDPQCILTVNVEEIGRSWKIIPKNGPGEFQVIGLWVNNGKVNEARYDLLPNTTYYVWVDQAPKSSTLDSKTIWGILRRGGSALDTLGYVIKCHPNGYPYGRSDLRFLYCPSSPTRDVQAVRGNAPARSDGVFSFATRLFERSSLPSPVAAVAAGETWFECDPGCCTGTTLAQ